MFSFSTGNPDTKRSSHGLSIGLMDFKEMDLCLCTNHLKQISACVHINHFKLYRGIYAETKQLYFYVPVCHVKLATQGIPRHPRFPFTGFFIICNMKRIMRCLCKSHRRSPCSADKIHLQIVTPVICCPFHTNFSTINHNKLKPYSYTLWVKKRVVRLRIPGLL